MECSKVIGMIADNNKIGFTNVTIRAEKTKNLTTLSLADEKRGVLIEVDYKDIEKLVKRLK